ANPAIGFYFNGTTPAAGLLYGNAVQVAIQLVSVLAAAAWSITATVVILFVIGLVTKLRAEPQEEIHGLDLSLHGESLADR
ncbi:MAG: hypothetical protein WC838_07465, partial [Candidatus Margulisiibacteriota bacterium]